MSPVGAAYSPWLFWDGRKDSLWAQALGPLEAEVEHLREQNTRVLDLELHRIAEEAEPALA